MCGIFGLISEKWQSQAETAASLMKYRGPDDYGIHRQGSLCLIHYRLSILDVSSNGHQPMISEDGRYVIILNGEIYNHLEIRNELQSQHFKSTSDTETVLYAYAKYGIDILPRLNGIFALAIYDHSTQELIIARDHLGVKPLYYHLCESGFAFSSELKSIASLTDINKDLDIPALLNYIQFMYSPGSSTPLKSIHKLKPGHFMRLSIMDCKIQLYNAFYHIPFSGNYIQRSEAEWIDVIDETLQNAVKRQLLSDVPLGYFISGGLDSSLIAAISRKINPEAKLKGFTVRNKDAQHRDGFADDYPYACKLASLLNIDLEVIDGKLNLANDFDQMIWQLDEPQTEVSALYVASIAKSARASGIYVLLSGMGGDDLFAGYRRHLAVRYDQPIYKWPFFIRRFLASFAEKLVVNKPSIRRLKKFLTKFNERNLESGMANYYKWLQDDHALLLFSDIYRKELQAYNGSTLLIESLSEIAGEDSPLNKMLYWDMHFFLPDHNLNYTDKMSMKYGVEVRVPFCDPELVNLSTQIPPELKIKNGVTKYLLKKVAERYLPNEIIYRPKTGFGGPLRQWITNDFKERVASELSKESIGHYGIFDYHEVQKLILDNAAGKVDASYSIMSLMAIQSWMKSYLA